MAGRAPSLAGALPTARGRRFAIVAARFHEAITRRLVEGARAVLLRHGAAESDVRVVWVPGAFEIPQVAARLAARGLAEVGRLSGVPATFGVITAETEAQAVARAGGVVGNRGEEAARAALEMVALFHAVGDRRERGTAGRRRGGRARS